MRFQKYHLQHENPYVGMVGPEEEEDKAGHDLMLPVAVAVTVAACSNACNIINSIVVKPTNVEMAMPNAFGHPISEKYLLHLSFNLLVVEVALGWIIRKMKMRMKVARHWRSQSQKKMVSESVLKPPLKCTA